MKKIILSLTLIFSCLNILSAQKVHLSFNPVQGKTYQFNYEIFQDIVTGEAPNETTAKQNMYMLFEAKVLENNKKTIKMAYVYKDISFEVISNMFSFKYKYNEPVENNMIAELMSKIFNSLIGNEFEVTHTSNGSVINVSGVDAIVESIKNAFEADSPMGQMMNGMLDTVFNEKMIKDMFEQSMKIYPDKKIQVGDNWTINQQMAILNSNMDINTTYTLESVTKQTANVSLLSSIQVEGLKGEQSGSTIFNLKTGMPQESNITQTFTSTAIGQPMKIKSEVKVRMD